MSEASRKVNRGSVHPVVWHFKSKKFSGLRKSINQSIRASVAKFRKRQYGVTTNKKTPTRLDVGR
jgi:hypothetical protein